MTHTRLLIQVIEIALHCEPYLNATHRHSQTFKSTNLTILEFQDFVKEFIYI